MEKILLEDFQKVGLALRVTPNQKEVIQTFQSNSITLFEAPAGVGKTFLAMAEAVRALRSNAPSDKKIKQIVCLRPAKAAGESIGFLPGTYEEKIEFYMSPFMNAGEKICGVETWRKLIKSNIICMESFSFLRGDEFNNAFVLIDEAQNCTKVQIEMALTRCGRSSKMIVTGDPRQPDINRSGFAHALALLCEVDGIGVARLTSEDNQRHKLVRDICQAYDADRKRSSIPITAASVQW